MTTRIISVALAKGGVGKTTTAVNLSAGLASHDRKVLLIDTDTQNQATKSLGMNPEKGLFDYVCRDAPLRDVMVEVRPNLYLIAGGESLTRLEREFGQAQYALEYQLANALKPLAEYFDYIIIDNAPGWNILAVNTLYYANEILCPCGLEVLAVQGLADYMTRLVRVGANSDIELRYILPTMADMRRAQTGEILNQLKETYGDLMCEPIRENVRLSEAPAYGQTIFEYAPKSNGAADYTELVARILNDEQA